MLHHICHALAHTQRGAFFVACAGLASIVIIQLLVILLRDSLAGTVVILQDALRYGFALCIFMGLGVTAALDRHVR
ncbi:MAG: hypothetical protein AAF352_06325, partial [Pseudomonadota bacterium]